VKTALVVARLSTIKTWRVRLLLPAVARICLSNNAAEPAVRAVALGRANWIFAGSDAGVQRAAAV